METTIPFDGFYNSIHDENLNRAVDDLFSDSRGDSVDKLVQKFWSEDSMDWGAVHNAYVKEYVKDFGERFKLAVIFEVMVSPKEYNFTTDRIFCKIELTEVTKMFNAVDKKVLDEAIAANFTSYDGFISFYKNSLDQWPSELSEWDHNQVGTLLSVFIRGHEDYTEDFQYENMTNENGALDNIVYGGLKESGIRLSNIAHALRRREERKFT